MAEVNKVVYGNTTLIDLTSDTVQADNLGYGTKCHASDGSIITGTAKFYNVHYENGGIIYERIGS